jgi:hypothetical protein
MTYTEREKQAKAYYALGLERVKNSPEPEGQKFPCGSRVRVSNTLAPNKSHFHAGVNATVEYTYAHAYGGSNTKDYKLNIDGIGSVAWYQEEELTLIEAIL